MSSSFLKETPEDIHHRCISRTEPDGGKVILVDRYQGKRLNSPNDLVVKSDGTIWFTDPPYGILSADEGYKAESELGWPSHRPKPCAMRRQLF